MYTSKYGAFSWCSRKPIRSEDRLVTPARTCSFLIVHHAARVELRYKITLDACSHRETHRDKEREGERAQRFGSVRFGLPYAKKPWVYIPGIPLRVSPRLEVSADWLARLLACSLACLFSLLRVPIDV